MADKREVEAALDAWFEAPGAPDPTFGTRMAAALDAAERVRWRPIDTAPRDGTWVLLGHFDLPGHNAQFVAFWHEREQAWANTHTLRSRDPNWQPTHWRPLPPPPDSDSPESK